LYEDIGNAQVFGYCDAEWEGPLIDKCSTSGYFVSIRGNVVSWKSKKQSVVACSSVEAEFRPWPWLPANLSGLNNFFKS